MPALNAASPGMLDGLRALLGPQGWRAPEDHPRYFEEPRGKWRGCAALILRPQTVEEVSKILARASAERVAVVPYGGGTGLVGGQVMGEGPAPLLLSLERMTEIRAADPVENAMIVEAGAVLADVQAAAAGIDRLFPLSLASEGTARLGGLMATNAGGVGVLRYGNTRDLVLGVEAVLAGGTILRGLKTLRKDNTGYDLRHLLIGSEGTLGVITAASLRLFSRPRDFATAFCAISGPEAATALLTSLRDALGETVSAFELMSAEGMEMLRDHVPDCPSPPIAGEWFTLIEIGGAAGMAARLEEALTEAFERGLVEDAVIAQSEAQRAAFWRIREDIPEANRKRGAVVSCDVSVPLARIPALVADGGAAVARVSPALRINSFGHVGDGNLHFNVFPPRGEPVAPWRAAHAETVKDAVHDVVHRLGGSVSAEHGLGRFKASDLLRYGDPGKVAAMRAIKAALDPAGILNPGAVLPPVP